MELGANSDPEVLRAACVEAFEQALGVLEVGALTAEDRAGPMNASETTGAIRDLHRRVTPREPQDSPSPTDR